MTARLRIHHLSDYSYERPVTASFNEVRLSPLTTPWQVPLETSLQVDMASWQHEYVDYWGTTVRVFEAQRSHRSLVIEATSVVEIDDAARPEPRWETAWADLADLEVRDRYAEYLVQTPNTRPQDDLLAIAEECAADQQPHAAALAVCTAVHDAMTYLPGSTGVHTLAGEAWRARSGVCQDYAHLVIGALRHVGVPARYASGYLHPKAHPVIGEPAIGESHAWVEWWVGDWTGHDPTNDSPVGERHVVVGLGRDYTDVPPIKGIIAGSGASSLDVSVEITRMA